MDLVLLDIEMPNMDGLTALRKLIKARPSLVVIMVLSLTERKADISLPALRMGATDYVTKPSSREALREAEDFKRDLFGKVRVLGRHAVERATSLLAPISAGGRTQAKLRDTEIVLRQVSGVRPQVLAIGSSIGGPPLPRCCAALRRLTGLRSW